MTLLITRRELLDLCSYAEPTCNNCIFWNYEYEYDKKPHCNKFDKPVTIYAGSDYLDVIPCKECDEHSNSGGLYELGGMTKTHCGECSKKIFKDCILFDKKPKPRWKDEFLDSLRLQECLLMEYTQ